MKTRRTYQPAQPSMALDRMKMAGAGALVAAGPVLGYLIIAAALPLGGHQ